MNSIEAEGRELFRKLVGLPDPAKNGPAPADLQDQFIRWRRRLLESKKLATRAVLDTSEKYVPRLTVRLLAYNLELLLQEAK